MHHIHRQSLRRCDVLLRSEYGLYQYKKYTDVRLVFAPEFSIAQFGGDPDNFTYPRYCLDFSLFRAYENGEPVKSADYLRWSHDGVKDGELTFVSGNPGSTGRLQTVAQMQFSRDLSYPMLLRMLKDDIDELLAFGAQSAENKRVAEDDLDSNQNSFKALTGFEQGLKDPKLMSRKQDEERKLRAAIDDDPAKKKKYGKLWDEIAAAYQEYTGFYKPNFLLDAAPNRVDLLALARNVVRYAEETHKPNEQRLREYQDAGLPSLEQQIYSAAPLSIPLEERKLATLFHVQQRELGADNPTVKAILAGRTPEEAARRPLALYPGIIEEVKRYVYLPDKADQLGTQ